MNRRLAEKAEELLSKEKGAVFKEPGGRINICLVYPNTYRVGMSNLGFQGIYGMLNSMDDVVCERAFLPDEDAVETYRRTCAPIISLESKRRLDEFDIVAFSVSFENDYPNILKILGMARIPFRASGRNEYHPLVIGGGVCFSFNPEPLAPVFDIIFIGEAEESLDEFMDMYKHAAGEGGKRRGKKHCKRDIKKNALNIEGMYVPEFYSVAYDADGTISGRTALDNAPEKIKRRCLKDLSQSCISTAVVTPESEFSNMYLIEAMRGCPWKCRFCLVGHIYSPVRKKGLETIKAEIERAKGDKRGLKIGLIGPSLTDYAHIKEVLSIEGVDFSITSLRASAKSAEIVGLMKGHKSVSIAPEAGTERLRQVINKRITEDDILETSLLVINEGIENLRLYFMIGLPTETMEDVEGIAEIAKKIRKLSRKGNIVLSVSTFVPKPFTPFQWHPMDRLGSVKEKLNCIKKALKDASGVKVLHDVPKYAHMQGLFSVGDRRVFKTLEIMFETDDWLKACSEAGVDKDLYIFRRKEFDEILPWDFIDAGIFKEKLWSEYMKSLS